MSPCCRREMVWRFGRRGGQIECCLHQACARAASSKDALAVGDASLRIEGGGGNNALSWT